MFRYYFGISIMCLLLAVVALLLSQEPAQVAIIFVSIAGAFLSIAFITSGPESRW